MSDKDIIICRCEDVSLYDLKLAIQEGFHTIEDIKRQLRIGMGPCQGATCLPIVQRELATYLNVPLEAVPLPKVRPMVVGVPLKAIAKGDDHD